MVRPIDLQDNFSKAPLAAREQQIQQASSELAQRHAAREQNDQHALDQERPVPTKESDAAENRVDDGGKGQRRSGQQQRRREQDSEAGDASGGDESKSDFSHLIDVVA